MGRGRARLRRPRRRGPPGAVRRRPGRRATVDEALAWGADLLLVHHPLFLRGVHGVAATTSKGRLVHRLITGGCALHVAHTNADKATPGVSDALARALGLDGALEPLSAGGVGRVGELAEPVRLDDFAARVAAALPVGPGGIRVGGRRGAAWSGGSPSPGERATTSSTRCGPSGADVYVTADLRHHPASEALEAGGPALVDAGHFATEWPWLADAEARLLGSAGGG